MNKYTYSVQTFWHDQWRTLIDQETQNFCCGWVAAAREYGPPPQLAMRILRSDDRVVYSVEARTEVDIGMVAGRPTAQQYRAAAERASARATQIELATARNKERVH